MLPILKLIFFGLDEIIFVSLESFEPHIDNLNRLFRENLAQIDISPALLHEVTAEILLVPFVNERKVYVPQILWHIFGRFFSIFSLTFFEPLLSTPLLFLQFGNNVDQLKNAVVNPVHFVFVLEEVILVNILNLEFVIFGATRDRTVLVI